MENNNSGAGVMVKRYCLVGKLESRCNCDMKEHPLGAFVGLKEYDSLERERDGLMEALEWVMKDYEGICTAGFVPSANWKRRVDLANAALAKGADHER